MSGGEIVGLVMIICLFGGPAICGIVYAVVQGWVKTVRHREDTDLKHRLVDAGFSVEEIERVMNAGRKQKDSDADEGSDDIDAEHTGRMKIG